MTAPLLTNDRAKREWAWILFEVGESAALEAIGRLPGAQRPYPLNVARVLKLKIPPELAEAPPSSPEVARRHLAEAFAIIGATPPR